MVTRTVLRSVPESMPTASFRRAAHASPLWRYSTILRADPSGRGVFRCGHAPACAARADPQVPGEVCGRRPRPHRARCGAWTPDPPRGGCALREPPEQRRLIPYSTLTYLGLLYRGLRLGDKRAEGCLILESHIRQNLAVKLDPGFLETAHEAAVGDVGGPARSSDADDPQRTEIA